VIAVTGATGALGGRVAAELATRGIPPRLVVRDPARAPRIDGAQVAVCAGYHDTAGMTEALRGADTLFLVSGRESATRVAEHAGAVDAAVAAGVERVVYTSFLGAAPDCTFTLGRQHHATEEHIRASGLDFTFLRDSMYQEMLPLFAADGVLAGPGGEGRAGFVARDDVAMVAAAVLAGTGHEGRVYDLTGPESLSLREAAEILGVAYVDETVDQAYASRAKYGAPDWEVEGWVSSYLAIARGELDVVTDAVPRLTGRRARALREMPRAG
jgi:uncharacterized protein YbjT (DUF2867 family)